MRLEREMRRTQLVATLGNDEITFEGEQWLVVAVLPLRVKRRQVDALFTEAMVQFLRYAAQVERLRQGADIWDNQDGAVQDGAAVPRRLSAAERKLIELAAMAVVRNHLEAQNFTVRDVASRESYDFEVHRGNEMRFVEVKGTTVLPWSVELTAPEHRVASRERDRYDMYVVVFEDIDHLDEFDLVDVGNPIAGDGYEVVPVRYRVRER